MSNPFTRLKEADQKGDAYIISVQCLNGTIFTDCDVLQHDLNWLELRGQDATKSLWIRKNQIFVLEIKWM